MLANSRPSQPASVASRSPAQSLNGIAAGPSQITHTVPNRRHGEAIVAIGASAATDPTSWLGATLASPAPAGPKFATARLAARVMSVDADAQKNPARRSCIGA